MVVAEAQLVQVPPLGPDPVAVVVPLGPIVAGRMTEFPVSIAVVDPWFGSLAGALIMIVLRTGLLLLNAPTAMQEILIGVIIIIAVKLDQLQHARAE